MEEAFEFKHYHTNELMKYELLPNKPQILIKGLSNYCSKNLKYMYNAFVIRYRHLIIDPENILPLLTYSEIFEAYNKQNIRKDISILFLSHYEEALTYYSVCWRSWSHNNEIINRNYKIPNVIKFLRKTKLNEYLTCLSGCKIPKLIDFYKEMNYHYEHNIRVVRNLLEYEAFELYANYMINRGHNFGKKTIYCLLDLEMENFKGEYDKYYNYFVQNINNFNIFTLICDLPATSQFNNLLFSNHAAFSFSHVLAYLHYSVEINMSNIIKFIKTSELTNITYAHVHDRISARRVVDSCNEKKLVVLRKLIKYHPNILEYEEQFKIIKLLQSTAIYDEKLIQLIIKNLVKRGITDIEVMPYYPQLLIHYHGINVHLVTNIPKCKPVYRMDYNYFIYDSIPDYGVFSYEHGPKIVINNYANHIRNCLISENYAFFDAIMKMNLAPEFIIDNKDYISYIMANGDFYNAHINAFAALGYSAIDIKCATNC